MRVLIAYDVNTETEAGRKRLRKVAKYCTNYGVRVQNSLFECHIDGTRMELLKNNLREIIDDESDSLVIYYLSEKSKTEYLGINKRINIKTDTLIL